MVVMVSSPILSLSVWRLCLWWLWCLGWSSRCQYDCCAYGGYGVYADPVAVNMTVVFMVVMVSTPIMSLSVWLLCLWCLRRSCRCQYDLCLWWLWCLRRSCRCQYHCCACGGYGVYADPVAVYDCCAYGGYGVYADPVAVSMSVVLMVVMSSRLILSLWLVLMVDEVSRPFLSLTMAVCVWRLWCLFRYCHCQYGGSIMVVMVFEPILSPKLCVVLIKWSI